MSDIGTTARGPGAGDSQANETKIVDFAAFRRKKFVENDLARGRKPLYVSHMDGKISGSPHFKGPAGEASESGDLGERIQRIRTSLQKINRLMAELKRMSAVEEPSSL